MHAKAVCPNCGQYRRLLPYPGQPQPVCAPCAGAPPSPVCGRCGNEDWLYHKDRCAPCVLVQRLTDLLGDAGNRARLGLQPLFDTLADAENPQTIIGWTRPSAHGTAYVLLARLGRGELPLSHDALDALNTPATAAPPTTSTRSSPPTAYCPHATWNWPAWNAPSPPHWPPSPTTSTASCCAATPPGTCYAAPAPEAASNR
jgi:hypothetical protein